MNEKILNYWIMYHEIHRFKRLGFSSRRIAQHFELDSRTVRKYLNMTEAQYEAFLMKNQNRNKTLNPYEDFGSSLFAENGTYLLAGNNVYDFLGLVTN